MYTPTERITTRWHPGCCAAVLAGLLASGAQAALACGWWGDAEQRDAVAAVLVGPDGAPVEHDEIESTILDDVVRMADRFRTGDRLPRSDADALRLYRTAALGDHAGAQYNLARMFELGIGVARDDDEAARWYRRAAAAGDVHAQHHLAAMYRDGRGVARDLGVAVRWLRAAAENGHSEVFAELASAYWNGRGVSRDPARAYLWWRRAELAGEDGVADHLRAARALLDAASLADAESRARAAGGVAR